jgi:FkbM family methyltransferase
MAGRLDRDLQALLRDVDRPVVFDIGANVGQSVSRVKGLVPKCTIHAFEPSPSVFKQLRSNTQGYDNVCVVNAAVASAEGRRVFFEYDHSPMSSFLRPGHDALGSVIAEEAADVTTIDRYCATHAVHSIDLLKIDTQGLDFEVLKGSRDLLAGGAIRVILLEVIFARLYEAQASFADVYAFLVERSFRLAAFYDCHMQDGRMEWADVMFVRD